MCLPLPHLAALAVVRGSSGAVGRGWAWAGRIESPRACGGARSLLSNSRPWGSTIGQAAHDVAERKIKLSLDPAGKVLMQPSRDSGGEGGKDDLIELLTTKALCDRLQRRPVPDFTVGLGARLVQPRQAPDRAAAGQR